MRRWLTCSVSMIACQAGPGESGSVSPVDDIEASPRVVEDCGDDDPMVLSLGTGVDGFVQLTEGDPVTMVHGPQGGWHMDVAGEVQHAVQDVSVLAVVTALDAPTPTVIAGADGGLQYIALAAYDDESCSGAFWGLRAFVDDFVPPDGIERQQVICTRGGQQVEIEITLTEVLDPEFTREPRTVTSTIVATAALDPYDAIENCD